MPILTRMREVLAVHQTLRPTSLVSRRSLALEGSENGRASCIGALDYPFMVKDTQAQRGQGLVLSHTAMPAKSHP